MNKAFYAVTTLALALVFMGCPDDEEPAPPTGFGDSSSNDNNNTPDTESEADAGGDAGTTDPVGDAEGDAGDPGDGESEGDGDTGGGEGDVEEDVTSDVGPEGCSSDDDCSSLNDCCTVGVCTAGECVTETLEDCCSGSSSECDDGNDLTTDVCAVTCEANGCEHYEDICPNAPVYISKNFDDASFQFMTPLDQPKTDNVRLSLSKDSASSPSWSLYLGDPSCKHYYNGEIDEDCKPVDPTAQSASPFELILNVPLALSLETEESSFLSFWVKMSAQPASTYDIIGADPITIETDWLHASVRVVGNEEWEPLYNSTDAGALGAENHTNGEWVFQTVDLTPWAGQEVEIGFAFTSLGGATYAPEGEDTPWFGVYIDDIVVQGSCDEASCAPGIDTCPDDGTGCTKNVCTPFYTGGSGICAYQVEDPGAACIPCSLPENCSDDTCYVYECLEGTCQNLDVQCCSENSSFPVLTAPPDVAYEGFEDADIIDWPIEDPYEDDNVSWQIDAVASYQGLYSLYFGDPDTQTYLSDPPNPAAATAWTPFFEVDTDTNREQMASFWLWMSTEFDNSEDPASEPTADFVDVLTVEIQRFGNASKDEGWSSTTIGNTTRGNWHQIGIALSEYRGETVRLGFSFNSGEPVGTSVANGFGGVRIDDLTVASACATDCLGSSDCDDGDQCTADWCELGECVHGEPEPNCCSIDSDCDDGNECTIDACIEGSCLVEYDLPKADICCSEGDWPGEGVASFEGTDDGFVTETESDPVAWHVASGKASSGEASMSFSDPDSGTYDSGGVSIGRMVSPPIQVPPTPLGNPFASFSFYMETEWDENSSVDFVTDIAQDELRVRVASDKNDNDILDQDDIEEADIEWVSHYVLNTTRGAWLDTRVDLDAYRGQNIQLVFEFDTGDDQKNGYAGPFIDDVSYGSTCLAPGQVQCIFAGQCVPPDECKLPTCDEDFKCGFVQKDTPECCIPTEDELKGESFEEDGQWEFESCVPEGADADDASMWQTSGAVAGLTPKDGDGLLYFGNGVNYASEGNGACGIASGPAVNLSDGVPWTVEFWLYLDIEKHNTCPDGGLPTSDAFAFRVIDDTTDTELLEWTKSEIQCSDYGKWAKRSFDLSEFAGQNVRLEFSFDTYDDIENAGKGIAVDDIVFIEGCPEF